MACITPNTLDQLVSFYAVPQLGAMLVPINYRLTADDFAYIINHSGACVVVAQTDYVDAVEGVRTQLSGVAHFAALEGTRRLGGLRDAAGRRCGDLHAAPRRRGGLFTINYTSGTTSRPKGVMITHRSAYMNTVGTLIHSSMTPADRYLWTLPMFHANGWTFVWTVTAVGARHICLRKVEPARIFELIAQEHVTILCAAPTVLIGIANAPDDFRTSPLTASLSAELRVSGIVRSGASRLPRAFMPYCSRVVVSRSAWLTPRHGSARGDRGIRSGGWPTWSGHRQIRRRRRMAGTGRRASDADGFYDTTRMYHRYRIPGLRRFGQVPKSSRPSTSRRSRSLRGLLPSSALPSATVVSGMTPSARAWYWQPPTTTTRRCTARWCASGQWRGPV